MAITQEDGEYLEELRDVYFSYRDQLDYVDAGAGGMSQEGLDTARTTLNRLIEGVVGEIREAERELSITLCQDFWGERGPPDVSN